MPPTQDPQTTYKPNLTCILLSARTRYIISIPNGGPCISSEHNKNKSYKCPICDVVFAVYSNGKVIYLQNMTKTNLTNAQYVKEYLKCTFV